MSMNYFLSNFLFINALKRVALGGDLLERIALYKEAEFAKKVLFWDYHNIYTNESANAGESRSHPDHQHNQGRLC